MKLINITNLSDAELEELRSSANTEIERQKINKRQQAERAFFDAARALYAIDPYYDFPVYPSDLEYFERVSLHILLKESGELEEN